MRALLVSLLLLAPAAVAVESSITPIVATPAWGSAHIYSFHLEAADAMNVDLSWTDPFTDLDFVLVPPRGPDCDPLTTDCQVWSVQEIASGATCPDVAGEYGASDVGFGPATESVQAAAPRSGEYQVWVMVAAGVPGVPVAYSLDVAGAVLDAPLETTVFIGSPHCKFVWGL